MENTAKMVSGVFSLFLLVGFYTGAFAQDMVTDLRSSSNCNAACVTTRCGCIPLADPYCATTTTITGATDSCRDSAPETLLNVCNLPSPLPGMSATTVAQIITSSIPLDVVDWVMVELRSGTEASTAALGGNVVAKKAGFLLNNGRIVDAVAYANAVGSDGSGAGDCLDANTTSTVSTCPDLNFNPSTDFVTGFDLLKNPELFVTIRHRNHIPIISSGPMDRNTDGPYYWDFTTSTVAGNGDRVRPEFPEYGDNQTDFSDRPLAMRPAGLALYAGNVDGDGSIGFTDDATLIFAANACSGYYAQDVDMNGAVQRAGDAIRGTGSRASVLAGPSGTGNTGISADPVLSFP